MNGWYIAGGIALWCVLAVAVTWIVAGSVRLRDRSRPTPRVSAPAERALVPAVRRPACCSRDAEGPFHHKVICTVTPCCVRCSQITGILTVPVAVSDAELSEIRKRAKPGTVVRRAEPQEDGWVL